MKSGALKQVDTAEDAARAARSAAKAAASAAATMRFGGRAEKKADGCVSMRRSPRAFTSPLRAAVDEVVISAKRAAGLVRFS